MSSGSLEGLRVGRWFAIRNECFRSGCSPVVLHGSCSRHSSTRRTTLLVRLRQPCGPRRFQLDAHRVRGDSRSPEAMKVEGPCSVLVCGCQYAGPTPAVTGVSDDIMIVIDRDHSKHLAGHRGNGHDGHVFTTRMRFVLPAHVHVHVGVSMGRWKSSRLVSGSGDGWLYSTTVDTHPSIGLPLGEA